MQHEVRTVGPGALSRAAALAFVAVMVWLTLAKVVDASFPFRGGDEQGHFSYVAHLAQTREWWPDLAAMPLYELSGAPREALNFLNHPPFFYWLAVPVYETLLVFGLGAEWLRAFTLIFSFAAFAVMASLMLRLRFGPVTFAAIAAVMAFLLAPTFASFFNNDQFALLGGALAAYGATRRAADDGDRAGLWLILAGIALCSVKLTSLIMVGLFVVLALLGRDPRRANWRALAIVAAAGAVATAPYAVIFLQHGSPAPETVGQIQTLRDFMVELGWDRVARLSPLDYLLNVPSIFSYQLGASTGTFLGFMAVCLAPLVAFLRPRNDEEAAISTVVRAAMIATYVVLVLHVAFAYRRYDAMGWLGDLYPRYYFPLLAAYALGWGLFLRRAAGSARELWKRTVSAIRPTISVNRPG